MWDMNHIPVSVQEDAAPRAHFSLHLAHPTWIKSSTRKAETLHGPRRRKSTFLTLQALLSENGKRIHVQNADGFINSIHAPISQQPTLLLLQQLLSEWSHKMFAKQIFGPLFLVTFQILCQLHGLPRSKGKHLVWRKIHRNGHKQSCIIDSFMRLNSVNFFNLIPLDPVYVHIWTMTSYPFQTEILGFSLVIWPTQIPKCQEFLFFFFASCLSFACSFTGFLIKPVSQWNGSSLHQKKMYKSLNHFEKVRIFCCLWLSWCRFQL